MTGIKQAILGLISYLYDGMASNAMGIVQQVMTFNDAELTFMNSLFTIIIPIAFIMVVIFWLEGIVIKTNSGKELSKDDFVQSVIWLLLGIVFVNCSYGLVSTFAGLSNTALNDFVTIFTDDTLKQSVDDMMDKSVGGLGEDQNTIVLIFTALIAIVARILCAVGDFAVCTTAITTKIEIIARYAFLPIGICSLGSMENKNAGISYIKKTIAASMYAAAMVMVCYIASKTATSVTLNGGTNEASGILDKAVFSILSVFVPLTIPFAIIGAMSSIKSVVNEAFGS